MTIFFAIIATLMGVGTIVTLRMFGVLACLPGVILTAMAFCLASLSHTVTRLRRRIETLESSQAPVAATVPDGGEIDPRRGNSTEAAGLLELAREHHAEKRFGNAKKLYNDVISQFPGTRQAAIAKQELERLKREVSG